jgi:AraC family transcriptional activator of pobA
MSEGIQWQYLFHESGTAANRHAVGMHQHEVWQIELLTQGDSILVTSDGERPLQSGDCLILPPGVPHAFVYPTRETAWLMVKFAVEGVRAPPAPLVANPEPMRQGIEHAIRTILASHAQPSVQDRETLAYLFAAYLHALLSPSREDARYLSPFLREVMQVADAHRTTYISVGAVAQAVGYSISHVSARFREEYGSSLKSYLDQQRAHEAVRLLSFSELSISEIARRLGFPDVYTFSRFFRRLTDQCPREFRKGIGHYGGTVQTA